MAFKAPHHQGPEVLNSCLQHGAEELFAMSILCPKAVPVWDRSSSGKTVPRTESYHSHPQQSFISLAFSSLHTYLKTS